MSRRPRRGPVRATPLLLVLSLASAAGCSASHHASAAGSTTTIVPAPVATDRYECTYGVAESGFGADGLPNIDGALTDRRRVDAVARVERRQLLANNPRVIAVSVGVGFARAWKGQNGGAYVIVPVHDYAILLHLPSAVDCPRGRPLPTISIDGVPIFYTVG